MTKQTINVGTLANDGTGDPARTAFGKCNSNFDELYAGAGSQATTLTGDVTGTGTGSFVATIANNAVSNAKAAQMPANTIKGNNTGSTGNATDLTAAQTRGVLALPTVTVAGRLARYTDTAGAQGSTSGIYEDGAGNVGIGTASPGSKLAVQNSGASDAVIAEWRNTSGNNNATFRTTDAGYIFGIHAQNAGDIYIKDSSDNVLLYGKHGGNVGIGTASPGAKVQISSGGTSGDYPLWLNSSIKFRGDGVVTWGSGADYGTLAWDTGVAKVTAQVGKALVFGANSSSNEHMRIATTGNVGIGTTSPATSLDVNGPIKAKSYTVATLPSAATVGAGTHSYVTDAASTFALGLGGTVSGGGGNFSRVTSDGSNWKQM